MKNFVISLKSADARRAHIAQEFGKQGIDFEFFDAVTPEQTQQFCQSIGIQLMNNQHLTDGEKACFMSHLALWQKMLDDDIEYMAIFEDDIYLGENASLFLNNDEWLYLHQLNFVKIETFLQERKLSRQFIPIGDQRKLHILKEQHFGAAGYILSKKTADTLLGLLKKLQAQEIKPIDVLMFEDLPNADSSILIHQLTPAICIQEFIYTPMTISMPSSLEAIRVTQRRNRPKRTLLQKIQGELSNISRKTVGKLSRTKIEFR